MRAVVASLLLVGACHSPRDGAGCDRAGFLCDDKANAFECRDGKWAQLPCRGPNGCVSRKSGIECAVSLDREHDGCASTAEGTGFCTSTGDGLMECVDGRWTLTASCVDCALRDDVVVCSPTPFLDDGGLEDDAG